MHQFEGSCKEPQDKRTLGDFALIHAGELRGFFEVALDVVVYGNRAHRVSNTGRGGSIVSGDYDGSNGGGAYSVQYSGYLRYINLAYKPHSAGREYGATAPYLSCRTMEIVGHGRCLRAIG